MTSEEREDRFGRAAERRAAGVENERALDQAGMGGHRGDKPFVIEKVEVAGQRLAPAKQVAGGAAEGGERSADLGLGRGLLKVEADLWPDPTRFEQRQRLARLGAARVVPDRGQSQSPRPVPTASATLAKPPAARRASRPRATSVTSERPL